jgi:hypothetical protein
VATAEGTGMKVYRGERSGAGCLVTVNGQPLDPRYDLMSLSLEGFEWGYDGGGPGQLALAILADHFGDDERALSGYKDFRSTVVSMLRADEWELTNRQVANACSAASHVVDVPMTLEELLDKVRRGG